MLRGLRGINQHHLLRGERRYLTHDLATDAAGGTGDQDALAFDGGAH